MTRDFNNQRRDDTRPSSRRPSAGKFGEERPSFPARPRLNRETVDRAWESGAQHTHADYRPRTNGGQPPRNNRYNQQQPSEHTSFPNERSNNRPYDRQPNQNHYRDNNYRDNHREPYRDNDDRAPRRFDRPQDGEQRPRTQPFNGNNGNNGNRRDFEERGGQRPYGRRDFENQGERRPYGRRDFTDRPGERGPGPRQDRNFPDNGQPRDRFSRPGSYEDRGRPRQDFRDNNRNDRPRDFERNDQPRDFERPRWQSRPPVDRRNDAPSEPRNGTPRQGPPAARPDQRPKQQFEGDYEQFAGDNTRQPGPVRRTNGFRPQDNSPAGRPFQGNRDDRRNQAFKGPEDDAQERHVTRLPDGRVLKGSRPSQRKQEQFWQEVSQDTNEIVGALQTPVVEKLDGVSAPPTPTDELGETPENVQDADATPKKRRKQPASAVTRGKKNASGGRSGPKPSQRGFKWPTP